MKDCQPKGFTEVFGDGTGEGCSVYISQRSDDPGGWWLRLFCETSDQGHWQFVKAYVATAPFRNQTRLLAIAAVPGAQRWKAQVQAPSSATSAVSVALAAGTYINALGPVSNGKGWSNAVTAVVNVPPGALVREVSAVGGGIPGSCQLTVQRDATTTDTLPAFPIAAGEDFALPDETCAGLVGPVTVTFTNTARQSVVWFE